MLRKKHIKKADYDQIANTYDHSRRLSRQSLEQALQFIAEKIGFRREIEFLDLGCGTGRFSIPIAVGLGYSVTASDRSEEMLSKGIGKDKSSVVNWIALDAFSLPYCACSFNVVFMSHLLHHVDKPFNVVKECYRVMKPNGKIINRYGSIEDIRRDPEHTFFPETFEIDETRTPTVMQVEDWFRAVGFRDVSSSTLIQQSNTSAQERLERVKSKYTSVLTLISRSAFEQGLKDLQEYASNNLYDPWLLTDRITFTTGTRC